MAISSPIKSNARLASSSNKMRMSTPSETHGCIGPRRACQLNVQTITLKPPTPASAKAATKTEFVSVQVSRAPTLPG
eukprot:1156636-Pelagomonas_calceolata.AAC.27